MIKFIEWMKLREEGTSTGDVAGFSPRLPIGNPVPKEDEDDEKDEKKKDKKKFDKM